MWRQKGPVAGNGNAALLNGEAFDRRRAVYLHLSDDFIADEPSRFKQLIEVYKKYS